MPALQAAEEQREAAEEQRRAMLVNLMQPAARDRCERLVGMPWIIAPPQLPLLLLGWLLGAGMLWIGPRPIDDP